MVHKYNPQECWIIPGDIFSHIPHMDLFVFHRLQGWYMMNNLEHPKKEIKSKFIFWCVIKKNVNDLPQTLNWKSTSNYLHRRTFKDKNHIRYVNQNLLRCWKLHGEPRFILIRSSYCYQNFYTHHLHHRASRIKFRHNPIYSYKITQKISYQSASNKFSRKNFNPSSQLIHKSPLHKKLAIALRIMWWSQPSCNSCLTPASING